jgi:anti-anti-sigma regulatory factor
MLRITLLDGLEQVTLKLEGSLVGVWVKETEAAWRSAKAAVAGRSLVVDLRAVNHVDQAGVYLLALLRQRGVRLVASGTAMAAIVRTIEKDWARNEGDSINGKATE